MADQPQELGARTLIAIACVFIGIAALAHGLIIYSNVGFVLTYGWPTLITYLVAAMIAIVIPIVGGYVGYNPHLHASRILATIFVGWITLEENLHAAEGWTPPPAAMHLAQTFVSPETAKGAVILILVLLCYSLLELCGHFIHQGVTLLQEGREKQKRGRARRRK